jgi:uncharacterized protein
MTEDPTQRPKKSKLPRWFLITVGLLSVGAAIVGIFLPVVPTTPLLLLAAACFLRSSNRLYRWLTTHRVFGKIVLDYYEHRVVSRRAKVVALLMLWVTIGSTVVYAIDALWLRALLLGIAIAVTAHITHLPSQRPDPAPRMPQRSLVESD